MSETTTLKQQLPQPQPGKHVSRGMAFLALFLCVITCGGIWWATRDDATREALRDQVAQELSQAQDTAVSTVVETLTPKPHSSVSPEIRGAVSDTPVPANTETTDKQLPTREDIALMETLRPGAITPESLTPEEAKKEDRIVRPAFIDEAASWMASCYQPGKDGGRLRFSVQWANARFAARTQGLTLPEMDGVSGRSMLLRHLLKPGILDSLYSRYGDGFMASFDAALRHRSQGAPLSDMEIRDAYRQYANYFASLAGALDSIASTPDLHGELQRMENASQNAVILNSQITETIFHMDEARERGDIQAVTTAQARIAALTSQYRQALNNKDEARQQTLNTLRKHGGRSLDNATTLFLAQWINRRLEKDRNALASAQSAAEVLRLLASRMQQRQ